eukprot:c2881_g1_i1 orf=96-590(+)
MACVDMGLLCLRDPSQVCDNLDSKVTNSNTVAEFHGNEHFAPQRGPGFPEFRHKQAREPPWMEGLHNLPLVQEELREKSRLKDGDLCVPKIKRDDDVLTVHQNSSALLGLIKGCAKQKDLHKGIRLHSDILKRGLLQKDIYVGTALLCMYAKCGALAKARRVLE